MKVFFLSKFYKKTIVLFFILLQVSCKEPIKVQKPYNQEKDKINQNSNDFGKFILDNENIAIKEAIKTTFKKQKFKKTKLQFWINEEIIENEINKFGDIINYTYQILDLNGNIIYDYKTIGNKTLVIEKQNEVRGIEYALKIMNKQEEATLLLPSFLAYGGYGDSKKIPPNFPLAVQLKTIKTTKNNNN